MSHHVCITGCTKGLGHALAQWFSNEKWTVSGLGRNSESIKALQREATGENGFFGVTDVTDDSAVSAFAADLTARLGVPDLLVNNAGIINANAPLWEIPPEEFGTVVDVNIKGVFNVLRHFTPRMIERGSGVMINLSSGWGRSTSPEVAPYCATKWAIEGLSRAMAQELPAGIAVAAMNPGIINTEMLQSCLSEDAANFEDATQWAKRVGPFLAKLDASVNGKPLTAP